MAAIDAGNARVADSHLDNHADRAIGSQFFLDMVYWKMG